jgi:hypothetical protein
MRLPLVAAVLAAVAAVPSAPASAVGTPGVGVVAVPATSFFRPNVGVAGLGLCVYAGAALVATAVEVSVLPLNERGVVVSCDLYDKFGGNVGHAGASSTLQAAVGAGVVLPSNTPVRICGSVIAYAANWGPATGSACAPVVPAGVLPSS